MEKHEAAFSRIYELLKHIDTSKLSEENIADLGYIKIYVKDIEKYVKEIKEKGIDYRNF